jgi:hypothetical protein
MGGFLGQPMFMGQQQPPQQQPPQQQQPQGDDQNDPLFMLNDM